MGNPDDSGDFDNIRIVVNTTQLESDWNDEEDLLALFVDDVIPAAIEWLQNAISVRAVDGPLTFDRECQTLSNQKCTSLRSSYDKCGETGIIIPQYMFDVKEICSSGGINCNNSTYPQGPGLSNTDLIIYFSGHNPTDNSDDCENVMGFASSCETNSFNRPIAGYINLCKLTIAINDVLTWEEVNALIIHEAFHVLGFASDLFPKFRENNDDRTVRSDVTEVITLRGRDRTIIKTPSVLEKARLFFNCDSMPGVELEEYPYSSAVTTSHWDNRIVQYDVMISYTPPAVPYSTFTLAVLQDSGWYNINWDYSQQAPYARNYGCDWYTSSCINDDGNSIDDTLFCSNEVDTSCNIPIGDSYCALSSWNNLPEYYDYFGDGTAGDNEYPDFCPIFEEYSNGDCRLYGNNNEGSSDTAVPAPDIGGLISGTSKCILIEGDLNGVSTGCFPTSCFVNYKGEYVGTRIASYKTSKQENFIVITCWGDNDNGKVNDFPYRFDAGNDYGFTELYCPIFKDICYKENPWICNGHGTINDDNECICSPGYFGIDCTIENTKQNRNIYDNTSSVSIYKETVCNGDIWNYDDDDTNTGILDIWNYDDDDTNTGILDIEITDIDDNDYIETQFKLALKNWIAILTDISQCNVDLREYNKSSNTVNTELYYYSVNDVYSDQTDNDINTVFQNLFGSSFSATVDVIQESEGYDPNVDNAPKNETVFIMFISLFFIFFGF